MTGTPVFDRISSDVEDSSRVPPAERVLPRLAEQMVAASLTSGRMLRELRERMFPSEAEPKAIAVAQILRDEFEQWVRDAEAAYGRARALEGRGQQIPGIRELSDLIGMTMAMLRVSLEDYFRSLDQAELVPTVTIEELRRELQLKRGA